MVRTSNQKKKKTTVGIVRIKEKVCNHFLRALPKNKNKYQYKIKSLFFKLELYPEALFQEVTEVHNNKSSAILQICKLLLFLHTSMSSTSLLEIKYQQQRFFGSSNLFYFNLKLQWNYFQWFKIYSFETDGGHQGILVMS